MYNPGKYRIYTIVLLIAFIISILLLSGSIWNIHLNSEKDFSIVWQVVLILIIAGTAAGIFFIAFSLTDTGTINHYVDKQLKDERIKVLKELEDIKDREKAVKTEETDIEELVNEIIPDSKGIKNTEALAGKLLANFAARFEMVQGLFYLAGKEGFSVTARYAFTGEHNPEVFKPGETIPGQAVKDQEVVIVGEIPENYFPVKSGLGGSLPKYLIFIPLIYKNKTIALFELASFRQIDDNMVNIFKQLSGILGERFAKFIK